MPTLGDIEHTAGTAAMYVADAGALFGDLAAEAATAADGLDVVDPVAAGRLRDVAERYRRAAVTLDTVADDMADAALLLLLATGR